MKHAPTHSGQPKFTFVIDIDIHHTKVGILREINMVVFLSSRVDKTIALTIRANPNTSIPTFGQRHDNRWHFSGIMLDKTIGAIETIETTLIGSYPNPIL